VRYIVPCLRPFNAPTTNGACIDGSAAIMPSNCEGGQGDEGFCVVGPTAAGNCVDGTHAGMDGLGCQQGTVATVTCNSGVSVDFSYCNFGNAADAP